LLDDPAHDRDHPDLDRPGVGDADLDAAPHREDVHDGPVAGHVRLRQIDPDAAHERRRRSPAVVGAADPPFDPAEEGEAVLGVGGGPGVGPGPRQYHEAEHDQETGQSFQTSMSSTSRPFSSSSPPTPASTRR